MNTITVIGTGLFAEELADIVSLINEFEISEFIEGIDKEKSQTKILDKPVVWINDIVESNKELNLICAIGSPKRKNIVTLLRKKNFNFTTIIHPSAQIFPSVSIQEGTIIGAASVIAAKTQIGKHVIINRGCLIGHHVKINDFTTISPGANIAGKVVIEEGVYIGMGAIIIDGIHIGSNSVIGAGAVVTKDVPSNVQVMGIPARITKELK